MLITSQKKKHLFLIRSAKFRERIDAAVSASQRASKYALQKADIAVSRTATARSKGEMADTVADHARVDSEIAVATAREFAPDFKPSVLDRFERLRIRDRYRSPNDPPSTIHHKTTTAHQSSNNNTPNHLLPDNRTQASTDSTPQKQISFPQTSNRRTSMLQKQPSVDYPNVSNSANVFPQNTLNLQQQHPQQLQQQHPQKQQLQQHQQQSLGSQSYSQTHQDTNQYNYGNQEPSDITSNYNTMPNQNYYNQSNQQYSNSNYMGNAPQMQAKYGNNMLQDQYGPSQSQIQTQYGQQQQPGIQQSYNSHMPPSQINQAAFQNYNSGNQIDQNYQMPTASVSFAQPYQNQLPNSNQLNFDGENSQYQKGLDNLANAPGPPNLRRNSRPVNQSSRPPHLGASFSQSSIDHFDHYKRPPSRDSSVDRYARAASRLSGSRQPSMDRTILPGQSDDDRKNMDRVQGKKGKRNFH